MDVPRIKLNSLKFYRPRGQDLAQAARFLSWHSGVATVDRGITPHELLKLSQNRRRRLFVASLDNEIVGVASAAFLDDMIATHQVLFDMLAVAPPYRRSRVGRALYRRVVSSHDRHKQVVVTSIWPDDNLPAHLFCRAMGLHCTQILNFRDRGEICYLFQTPNKQPFDKETTSHGNHTVGRHT